MGGFVVVRYGPACERGTAPKRGGGSGEPAVQFGSGGEAVVAVIFMVLDQFGDERPRNGIARETKWEIEADECAPFQAQSKRGDLAHRFEARCGIVRLALVAVPNAVRAGLGRVVRAPIDNNDVINRGAHTPG